MSERTYLGDSVYATYDGYHVWVYTDNGFGPNVVKQIALEPQVLDALNRYAARCRQPPDETPVPLCPVCGKPAERRAWCSAECEAKDTPE